MTHRKKPHAKTAAFLKEVRKPKHISREDMDDFLNGTSDRLALIRHQIAEWRNHVEASETRDPDQAVRQRAYAPRMKLTAMAENCEIAIKAVNEMFKQFRAVEEDVANIELLFEPEE